MHSEKKTGPYIGPPVMGVHAFIQTRTQQKKEECNGNRRSCGASQCTLLQDTKAKGTGVAVVLALAVPSHPPRKCSPTGLAHLRCRTWGPTMDHHQKITVSTYCPTAAQETIDSTITKNSCVPYLGDGANSVSLHRSSEKAGGLATVSKVGRPCAAFDRPTAEHDCVGIK